MKRLSAVLLVLMIALSGCSHSYTIEARIEGGRLLFVYARRSLLDERTVCVKRLTVFTDDKTASASPPDDSAFESERRVWEIETQGNHCFAEMPLAFGVVPKGAIETIKKHVLKPDVIYQVSTIGPGSSGSGSFRLRQIFQVENLE